jgi:hypothetical protein
MPPILHVVETYNSIFIFTKPLSQGARHPDRESTLPPPKYEKLLNIKVKFALEEAMKAQRGSRCIVLLFL